MEPSATTRRPGSGRLRAQTGVRRMRRVARLAVVASVLLVSCSAYRSYVRVADAGTGVRGTPKPKDCAIPILRTKPPDRPYDEIAVLHYGHRVFIAGDPAGAERVLRERACELGADALIVAREFVPGVINVSPPSMAVIAIVYRPAPAAPPQRAAP